ncbi:hypothetical protein INS49_010363 [Diaporthe citri]|uniref:uncharacterized protein n=1 Tax=Diaporthe citri TaxID=83186 RepID=UPI001C7EEBA2|nr:uncharacterized protein INS49_010363 [Diaporthe citri]KAG6362134.1 hypothetical protein INS49_010363 [Diaporthe citri]
MLTPATLQTTLPLRPRGVAQGPVQPSKVKGIAAKWHDYISKSDNDLDKWKQLCSDLGKPSDTFTSKTQCRKALRGVWVNIHDFLAAENKPKDVRFFKSERALAAYTRKTHKVFPRRDIKQGDPLRDLLAHIL